MELGPIIERIEDLAFEHPFGELPELRKRLKALKHTHRRIFYTPRSTETTKANWSYAFHYGGRRELQFNVGFEDNGKTLRYGAGFSFQGSRNLTSLAVLKEPVERFNRFVKKNPAYLSRFSMWNYQHGRDRSERLPVRPIPDELFRWGVFVFVGNTQPANRRSIDYDRILDDLDWLVPLYEFVEGGGKAFTVEQLKSGFMFQPGCAIKTFSAKATFQARNLEIDLRHKRIQNALHHHLVSLFGVNNVRTELSGLGTFVDVAVQRGVKLWYYEVKTSGSVKECIREAIGQLLEYSYWPGSRKAEKLFVIGEQSINSDSQQYIATLRSQLKMPIEYRQFDLKSGRLLEA